MDYPINHAYPIAMKFINPECYEDRQIDWFVSYLEKHLHIVEKYTIFMIEFSCVHLTDVNWLICVLILNTSAQLNQFCL